METWVSLETMGFPGYEISDQARVRNERSEKILKTSLNTTGVMRVGLMKREEGKQVNAALARLVATMFVPGKGGLFNTPIHLNGDRQDCRAANLMWRPRYFAIDYHNQITRDGKPLWDNRLYDVETSVRYADSKEAARKNGLLETKIVISVANGEPCFPTWQIFARVED